MDGTRAFFTLKISITFRLRHEIEAVYKEINMENEESAATCKTRLLKMTKKPDSLEEKYYVNGEMSRDTFEKFYFRFKQRIQKS